jgi:hypothetical protein
MRGKNKLDAGGRGASAGVELVKQVRVVAVQFPRAQVETASNHCREFFVRRQIEVDEKEKSREKYKMVPTMPIHSPARKTLEPSAVLPRLSCASQALQPGMMLLAL